MRLDAVRARRHLPGEAAFRIVRAADEGAEAAHLERQLAGAAVAGIAAGSPPSARGREDVRPEQIVERVEHLGDAQFLDLVDRADEAGPEILQHLLPVDLVVGDAVELLFQRGGEIVFDIALEEAFQEADHDAAFVLRDQPLLVDAHIAAVLQHLQDRGVGGGPADAELLHALDQRGFGKARRRLGEVLRGVDRLLGEPLVFRHGRQPARLLVLVGFVLAFLIEREEAVEFHHLAGGAQVDIAAAGLGDDIDGGALEFGGFHLAGDRAVPDQLVEPRLVAVDIFGDFRRRAAGIGRAHRFVRFLRVLRLVLIGARRAGHIVLAVILADHGADVGNRLRRHVDAVGAHIGDEAGGLAVDLDAFVEALCQPHGDGRRKAELAADASCCMVEVVKGGGGLRRAGLASTAATVKRRALQRIL